jgi:hypothetical protein
MNPFTALLSHSKRALRSTAPLYKLDDRNRRELFATGLFFEHDGRHFVLSAAHALVELRTQQVWVGGEETIIQLTGPFFHTGQPGQVDFENDSFDVGFVPLSHEQVAALTDVVYVSDRAIERAASRSSKAQYFAVGFIARDFRPSASQAQITAEGTGIMAVEAPPEKYVERAVSGDTHLLLSFDRLRTHSEDGQAATPRIMGMSGCGIWRRGLLPFSDTVAALLTEHHDRGCNVIVSTRLSVIIPALTAFVSRAPKWKAGRLTTAYSLRRPRSHIQIESTSLNIRDGNVGQ